MKKTTKKKKIQTFNPWKLSQRNTLKIDKNKFIPILLYFNEFQYIFMVYNFYHRVNKYFKN